MLWTATCLSDSDRKSLLVVLGVLSRRFAKVADDDQAHKELEELVQKPGQTIEQLAAQVSALARVIHEKSPSDLREKDVSAG